MTLCPPTIGERLAKCGRLVAVWGIVPGADVELKINGSTVDTRNISGSSTTFELTSDLNVGDVVTARQTMGSEESLDSPGVEVGDVELPPPPPRLRPSIYRCTHRIYADGMAPGSTVRLTQMDPIEPESTQIAEGIVNRHGFACLEPRVIRSDPIFGHVSTCGTDSASSSGSNVVAAPAHLPAPIVHEPLFGCQNGMDMSGLTEGARIDILSNGSPFAFFHTCWDGVHVNLPRQLVVNEEIAAVQTMNDPKIDCNVDGDVSSPPAIVIPPDERIKPSIRQILYDGDRIVRVQNQIDGAEIAILLRDNEEDPEKTEVGRAGASEFEEISLNDPLLAGQIISASQTLCGRTETSEEITVQPRPATIPTPSVRSPLYECGVRVVVDGLLPGAQVYVYQNGFYVGHAWANSTSVTVLIGPRLVNGCSITALQRIGGVDGATSSPITVQSLTFLPAPTILPPIRLGERSIRVGGVVPGAYVQVSDRGTMVGTADAAEVIVSVPISQPVESNSVFTATQTLCGETSTPSETSPDPHADPGLPGSFTPASPSEIAGGSFEVPPTRDAPGFTVGIGGELTFPRDPSNPNAVDPSGAPYPLVVVVHGNHRSSAPSYQGYRYLTNHLASHGMICISVDLNDINGRSIDFTGLDARGLAILEHIRILLERNTTSGDLLHNMIDANNIGLVGHSRGGEGVVAAQDNNLKRPAADRFNIKGIVPIAPTNGLDFRHQGTPLFIIYGSADADVSGGTDFVNPFLIYDRSERLKAMIFIHHARHNGFNEVWVRPGEENEPILPGSLSPAQHQAIAKAYINAFFQSVFFNCSEYDVYFQGPVKPLGLGSFSIHNQYQVTDRMVLDNFGDDDLQLGLLEESTITREQNTLGQTVTYTQTGMDVWFDAEFRSVSQNPHDSRGSSLKWDAPESYISDVNTQDVRSYNVLAIRLGQQYSTGSTLNPSNLPQDLLVTLVTTAGEATVRVGSITDLPFPHERGGLTKAALKTVRIPLVSFTAINPSLRLDQVSAIRLNFGITQQGAISVDDIEFSK